MGTRLALGASRGRVVRQLLTESVLLGLMASAAGLLIAFWLAPWVTSLQDPGLIDSSLDPIVFVFAACAGIVSGLVAGAAPARYGRRGDLVSALNANAYGAHGAATPTRVRSLFLGSQAAAAMILLVITALTLRSFVHQSTLNLGLDPDRLVNVSGLGSRYYNGATAAAYWDSALPQVRQLPGIAGVALALKPPFDGGYIPQSGPASKSVGLSAYLMGASSQAVYRNEVSPEYFATVGAQILRGRIYTVEEARTEAPVAVISNSLAQTHWKGEDPIGSSLARVWGEDDRPGARVAGLRKPAGTRIIGVVSDAMSTLRVEDGATLYLPLRADGAVNARLVVNVDGDPAAISWQVRDVLRSMDPRLRPTVTFVGESRARELSGPKGAALLTVLLGGGALTLAVIGLFGVTAFVVRQRRHEISIRLALGAAGGDVVSLLLRDTLRPVAIGMAIGVFIALIVGHVIRGSLYGISGHDPIAVIAAVVVLMVAVVAAALGPARRALRVDPAEMLKQS